MKTKLAMAIAVMFVGAQSVYASINNNDIRRPVDQPHPIELPGKALANGFKIDHPAVKLFKDQTPNSFAQVDDTTIQYDCACGGGSAAAQGALGAIGGGMGAAIGGAIGGGIPGAIGGAGIGGAAGAMAGESVHQYYHDMTGGTAGGDRSAQNRNGPAGEPPKN